MKTLPCESIPTQEEWAALQREAQLLHEGLELSVQRRSVRREFRDKLPPFEVAVADFHARLSAAENFLFIAPDKAAQMEPRLIALHEAAQNWQAQARERQWRLELAKALMDMEPTGPSYGHEHAAGLREAALEELRAPQLHNPWAGREGTDARDWLADMLAPYPQQVPSGLPIEGYPRLTALLQSLYGFSLPQKANIEQDATAPLRARIAELKKQNTQLHDKLAQLAHPAENACRLAPAIPQLPANLHEVCLLMEQLYGERIVFSDDALRTAAEYTQQANLRVAWDMLYKLAHSVLDRQRGGLSLDEKAVRDDIGYELAMSESPMVKKSAVLMKPRTTIYKGKSYEILPHLKYGIKQRRLRIYFTFMKEEEQAKILVGAIGEHLPLVSLDS